VTPDYTDQRQHVHAYIDRLPGDQLAAVHGLLESMLSPLDRRLALAPVDDEPVTSEDIAAIKTGLESLERGGASMEEVLLADFGLTMNDFRKLPAEKPGEDPVSGR